MFKVKNLKFSYGKKEILKGIFILLSIFVTYFLYAKRKGYTLKDFNLSIVNNSFKGNSFFNEIDISLV